MNPNPEIAPPLPPAAPRMGLAIASLVLGILACVLSLFLVGAVCGLVGQILGLVHVVRKRGPNALAWWGMGLSVAGILASVALGAVYYHLAMQIRNQAASSLGAESWTKWEGLPAPDVSLTTLDGRTIQLDQLKGKRVVLDFWATWCVACRLTAPRLSAWQAKFGAQGLAVIGITDDSVADATRAVASFGMRYAVGSDESYATQLAFGVTALPTVFLIDKRGVVRDVSVGFDPQRELEMEGLVQRLLAEPGP